MATISTSPAPTRVFADALNRLRTVAHDYPTEFKWLAGIVAVFLLVFFMPVGAARFDNAFLEGLALLNWYAREHVMLCLVPAFFIAGAIAVFISQDAVMKYLGPAAHKTAAYGVASVSGSILAVCSCTVLPLFGGIYRRGAGLGPAIAFLYSGPAINVLAIVLTAKILGMELGVARRGGRRSSFALVIGLIMHRLYRREEQARAAESERFCARHRSGPAPGRHRGLLRPAGRGAGVRQLGAGPRRGQRGVARDLCLEMAVDRAAGAGLAGLLVGRWRWIWQPLAATAGVVALLARLLPHHPELAFSAGFIGWTCPPPPNPVDGEEWLSQTWGFAKLILPLLLGGVLLAGFLLGRPGHEGIIPSEWVGTAVGGNSLAANFLAAVRRRVHVLRHPDRSPYRPGPAWLGHGQGAGAGVALGGAGAVIAEHAGDSQHSRHPKDGGLLFAGGGHGRPHRPGVRYVLSIEERIQ